MVTICGNLQCKVVIAILWICLFTKINKVLSFLIDMFVQEKALLIKCLIKNNFQGKDH